MRPIINLLICGLIVGCADDDNNPSSASTNHAPVIQTVTASPSTIRAYVSPFPQPYEASLQCVATDSDGDPLSFAWFCPNGDLQGDGDTDQYASFKSRTVGQFWITVRVSDGKSLDIDSVRVTVQ